MKLKISFLRRRTPAERAEHLSHMAEGLWRRCSSIRFDRLEVAYDESSGQFHVNRDGFPRPTQTFENHTQVEKYISRFYNGVRERLSEGCHY